MFASMFPVFSVVGSSGASRATSGKGFARNAAGRAARAAARGK